MADVDPRVSQQPFDLVEFARSKGCRLATSLDHLETSGLDTIFWPAGSAHPIPASQAKVFARAELEQEFTPTPLDPINQAFRHSGWKKQRATVFSALLLANSSGSRVVRFCGCGRDCVVLRSKDQPQEYRIAARCCKDRFCLPCGQDRSRVVTANVLDFVKRRTVRFVTLTLRSADASLASQVDRIFKAFKRLRKHPVWSKSQDGGIAFLEITINEKTHQWHPHLHILADGRFILQAALSKAWKQITGDSHIVDVRLVRDPTQVGQYVSKYASKPFHHSLFLRIDKLTEAVEALQGRRMILTFGSLKGVRLSSKPDNDAWERVDTLFNILVLAAGGDTAAHTIATQVLGERLPGAIEWIRKLAPWKPPKPPKPTPMKQLTFASMHRTYP